MTDMLLDYVVAAEEKINPPTESSSSGATSDYVLPYVFELFSNSVAPESTGTRVRCEFGVYKDLVTHHFKAGNKMESAKEMMAWFKLNKLKISMISHFASIIHVIPPSQIENERDFSLAVVIACAKRAALSAENLACQ